MRRTHFYHITLRARTAPAGALRASLATGLLQLCLALALLVLLHGRAGAADRQVRVGIFPVPPLNYLDESGEARGLYPDLLQEIAAAENWRLTFVPGSFARGLERLAEGEIDLMLSIAKTPEREKIFDFTAEQVAEVWGQVYAAPHTGIESIADLEGARVGVMKRDLNARHFAAAIRQFDVEVQQVEYATHAQIFAALRRGDITAGVAPHYFGLKNVDDYGLVATPIQFSPFSIYFATSAGRNADLRTILDRHLRAWKNDHNSVYYRKLAQWMTGEQLERKTLPPWVYPALALTSLAVVALIYFINVLSRRLTARSREMAGNEYRHAALIESVNAIPWEFSLHKRNFSFVGDQAVFILGFPSETLHNIKSWQQQIPPEDHALFRDFFAVNAEHHPVDDIVFRIRAADGRLLWLKCTGTLSAADNHARLVGFMVDVTTLKENELKIQESEHKFRQLFNEAVIGIGVVDVQSGLFISVNRELARHLDQPIESLVDSSPLDLLSPHHRPHDDAPEHDPFRQLSPETTRIEIGDDETAPIKILMLKKVPIKLSERETVTVFVNDITELEKAEEEMERHRYLLESSQRLGRIGSWKINLGKRTVSWTTETYRILGVPLNVTPSIGEFWKRVHPDDRIVLKKSWDAALQGEEYDIEHRLVVDDRIVWVRVKASLTFGHGDQALLAIGFIQDITEKKQYAQELLEKNIEMEQFLYTASHDLKSPLVTMRSFLELLKNDLAANNSARIATDLGYIQNSADKMAELLGGLLHYSQLGRMIDEPKVISLKSIIDNVLSFMAGPIMQSDVDVRYDCPDIRLFGDNQRLSELWQNLIENAIKFMQDQPQPRIEIGCRGEGRNTVFYVEDNGCGVPPEFANKVFVLFEKLDRSSAGSGLGLAIVKRVVELYDGRIWIEPGSSGSGTRFNFTLPDAVTLRGRTDDD